MELLSLPVGFLEGPAGRVRILQQLRRAIARDRDLAGQPHELVESFDADPQGRAAGRRRGRHFRWDGLRRLEDALLSRRASLA